MTNKTTLTLRLQIANALSSVILRHPDNTFEFKDPNMNYTSFAADFGVSANVVRHIATQLYGTYRRATPARRAEVTLRSVQADLDFIANQLGFTLPSKKLEVE